MESGHLSPTSPKAVPVTDYVSPADCSKQLKRDLRATFPSTRFALRLKGGTCTVTWTDGPSVDLVDDLAGRYQSLRFDGSTDSESSVHATMPDGRRSTLGYVFCHRDLSDCFVGRLINAVALYWGGDVQRITADEYRRGRGPRRVRADLPLDWQTAIYQAAADRRSVIR